MKKTDFGDQQSQADVGTSEDTCSSIVIIESDEEDNGSLFQINLCVFSKFFTWFTWWLIRCI